jgi:hypothetical protein
MDQFAQVAGAVLVLAAFVLVQLGRLSPDARRCLLAIVAGSGVLAASAAAVGEWGFLGLEAVWAAVSAWALYTHDRAREATA